MRRVLQEGWTVSATAAALGGLGSTVGAVLLSGKGTQVTKIAGVCVLCVRNVRERPEKESLGRTGRKGRRFAI